MTSADSHGVELETPPASPLDHDRILHNSFSFYMIFINREQRGENIT